MREVRYRAIADELRERVGKGDFGAGRLLPSESELSASFGVSRVTVRKALELLRDEGLIDARQGFGWFVSTDPVRQPLARLGTIEEQLAELGRSSERKVVGFGFVAAPPRVRQVLGTVDRARGAAGQPGRRRAVRPGHGVVPGGGGRPAVAGRGRARRRSTSWSTWPSGRRPRRSGRWRPGPQDAALLAVPVGSPMLRCERVTRDAADEPVLVSEFLFPAHRTEFVVDLPRVEPSIGPSGLRLVE